MILPLRQPLHLALLLALAGAPLAGLAQSTPTATDQSTAGLADTPGPVSEVGEATIPVTEMEVTVKDGRALLNSAVLLKIYYYAYAGVPVDYSAILTPNPENIDPPAPVQPSAEETAAIDELIGVAKAHPKLVIEVGDIALDPYETETASYPIDNRLFIANVGYYFDNSPYHYIYTNAAEFRNLKSEDPEINAEIDAAIANYQHFDMHIFADITGVEPENTALELTLDHVDLIDGEGKVLITHAAP